MSKFFSVLLVIFLASCSSKREGPVIYFSNASEKPIKNLRCTWVNTNLSLAALNPGDTRSQSFYISKNSEFLGLIRLSWTNGEGNVVKKEFNLGINNLPSIADHTTYSYMQLYLDQHDVEIISSDSADLGGKTRRMERVLLEYSSHHTKGTPVSAQTALIRVEPVTKNLGVPNWLANSY